jgi:chromosome segregation ATPase
MNIRQKVLLTVMFLSLLRGVASAFDLSAQAVSVRHFGMEVGVSGATTNLSDSLHLVTSGLQTLSVGNGIGYGAVSFFAVMMIVFVLRVARDSELKALKSQVDDLTAQLADADSAKIKAERQLKHELKRKQDLLDEKNSVVDELDDNLRKIQSLTLQLRESQQHLIAREKEIRDLNADASAVSRRLADVTSAKEKAEKLLREGQVKKSDELESADPTLRATVDRLNSRTLILESQLKERERLIDKQQLELKTLRSEVTHLDGKLSDVTAAKKKSENALHEELKRAHAAARAKELAVRELEETLGNKTLVLDSQLSEKNQMLNSRDAELTALRSQVNVLEGQRAELEAIKNKLEISLQEEQNTKRSIEGENQSAIQDLNERFNRKVRELESQLSEKQKLLASRDGEREALKSELNSLAGQLAEMGSAKVQGEGLLRDELRKAHAAVKAKEVAFQELEETLAKRTQALESQLSEKNQMLNSRDAELMALRSQLNGLVGQLADLESVKEQVENSLREQLNAKSVAEGANQSAIQELNESYNRRVRELESQLSEKQKLLVGRDGEREALKSELNSLAGQLAEMGSAKEQAERVLWETLKNKPALLPPPDESLLQGIQWALNERINALQVQLNDKDELLRARDKQIESLNEEVREKRILFAAEERKIWKEIEARNLWKGRLSKIGFRF